MNPARYESLLKTYHTAGLGGVVQDASPHRLIQLLLDGAASRLAVARGALGSGDAARKGQLIGGVMAIFGHLRGMLDHQTGGEIARNLDGLYDYMLRRLLEASSLGDVARLDEVMRLLGEIRSAWDAITPAPVPPPARVPVAAWG